MLLSAGNFVSWPLLEDQISRFRHNIKPYWLTPPLAKVKGHGLLAENALWSAVSNRLYLFCCAPFQPTSPQSNSKLDRCCFGH